MTLDATEPGRLMSRIVIVDDRITNRNIFAKLAASIEPGVVVEAFGEPEAALRWIADATPDLVITDYKMPSMDGAQFIARLRETPGCGEVPVIVITVYEERSFRLRALESGATDFLHSPVDHYEFVTRARNLLRLHKHRLLLADRAVCLKRELDDSERSRERVMRDSSERLAQVIDTVALMISAAGPDGRILFVNAYQTAFCGLDPGALVGASAQTLFGPEHGARSHALDRLVFESGAALPSYEETIPDHRGLERVFLTTKAPLTDASGLVSGVLTSSLDITARKRTEAHLHHLAHHDSLTDLPNRTLLRERMRGLIARARRGDQLFALHLLDLDRFKSVNDSGGHTSGDRLLQLVAARLRDEMHEADTIARLGGDEFAVLQTHVVEAADASRYAARILAAVASAAEGEAELATTVSIGIAIHPADGSDGEDLLKNADLAMYKAKAEGGATFCFYAADMHARARATVTLDGDLRHALANGEFELFYQPQVDLRTGAIAGAEALLRWRRPGHGLVSPGVFLPRAEENGFIAPINEWVLREACAEARRWVLAGLPRLRVSVNLSPVQFRKRTVPLLVAKTLADTGLDPRLLDLELTESMMMRDLDAVANDLRQVMALGVNVSIDDFGTGFCSLSYVKRFPVNRIKIDQSFVRDIASDVNDAAIVRAIITLGHSLDLEVIAEGVETAEQLARLRAEGCDGVQGYYFGRPMPAAAFMDVVRGGPAPHYRTA